jgi:hypothetical protein
MNDKEKKADSAEIKRQIKEDQLLSDDMVAVFASESGRRVLDHLKQNFAVGLPLFCKASHRGIEEPLIDAAIKDGNHEVIRYIETRLELSYK